MKELLDLTEVSNEDLPEIYCDLDEVLVDFLNGAAAALGGDFVKMDKDERWNKINQTKGFWENLGWKPGGKKLYQFIIRYNPHVLSAFSGRDPASKNGKMKWLMSRLAGASARSELCSFPFVLWPCRSPQT